ncbi:MAG: HEAT repeat domain-containing protein [Planctomycetota bacterium]|nr:HEAT repeat domain-containing protein [Planctomycetota bacterium]
MRNLSAVLVFLLATTALASEEGLLDPDPAIRRQTADGLSDPAAVPALAHALGDPNPGVRKAAAGALERIGEKASPAVKSLVRLAEEDEGEVRAAAIRALATVEPGAGSLGRWLETHRLRDAVVVALRPCRAAWLSAIEELFDHRSWYVREAACRILAGAKELPKSLRITLRRAVADPAPAVSRAAFVLLATKTPVDAMVEPFVLTRLASGGVAERRIAVCLLRPRAAAAPVEAALLNALDDEDPIVRREAAIGLAPHADPRVVASLMQALRESSLLPGGPVVLSYRNLRARSGPGPALSPPIEIARALASLGSVAASALVPELSAPSLRRRLNAIRTLDLTDEPPYPDLDPLLSDPDPLVTVAAATVLARDPARAGVIARALVAHLPLDTDEDDHIRRAHGTLVLRHGAFVKALRAVRLEAQPLLDKLLNSGDERVRRSAEKMRDLLAD